MRLKGKVAIVTGASSGIGKAIADRFAAEGAHVAVNYLPKPENVTKAEEIVAGFATEGIAVGGDVSRREDVERNVSAIVERFGRLDIAVANAGIEINRPFLDVTDDEWNRIMGVNLFGAFLVAQAAARQFVKQGPGGKLIFISSVHEDIPFPGYTAYCASKGGLRMMMRNLAIELAPNKINVNNIAPGAIETPINRKVLSDPKALQEALSEIPWNRFGKPHEVAGLAAYLASDEADYVTGSTFYIDGGLTQQVTRY